MVQFKVSEFLGRTDFEALISHPLQKEITQHFKIYAQMCSITRAITLLPSIFST
jgi:hypothetical protein